MCEVVYKPQNGQLVAICLDTQEQIATKTHFGFYCPNNCGLVDDQLKYAHSGQSQDWVSPKKLQQRNSEIRDIIKKPMSRCDTFIMAIENFSNEVWEEHKRGR